MSIITPTHDLTRIEALAASIRAQTVQPAEWVVVPNNGALNASYAVEGAIIRPCGLPCPCIGYLKRFAADQCTGDVIIEADHDDELSPDALEHLAAAFKDPNVDFVYSNHVEARRTSYPAPHWQTRRHARGWEIVAKPPIRETFLTIYTAPNHVRAWRRSFYEAIGGHDWSMSILDDHDLLCRTYLNARKIVHIDKPLYYYNRHKSNTCLTLESQQIIAKLTREIGLRYFPT